MARCKFIQPMVVRLPLADGDWIDVKKELTAGEQRRVFTKLVKSMQAGQAPELNPDEVGKTKLVEYIVGWSFCDANNKPVAFSATALDALDSETFNEISRAIDAHEEAAEKARAERKNGPSTPPTSEATSTFVAS